MTGLLVGLVLFVPPVYGIRAFDALDEIKRSVKYGTPDGRTIPDPVLKEIITAQPR